MPDPLPIDPLLPRVLEAAERGPVVLTAPTGSGKSTQVPRALASRGRVLVVEPRRVACRALAHRVAELEGTPLGRRVGYAVRDDRRAGEDTEVLFVTPGVALRMMRGGDVDAFATLVLDEFHERGLDLDLLLALALQRGDGPRLVVTSATMDAEAVAAHLGGEHLRGEGRQYPVELRYRGDEAGSGPSVRGLEERVRAALAELPDGSGDVLVFLPGKGEIRSVQDALRGLPFDLRPLHGGLTLDEQAEVLRPRRGGPRRVILSTNVAETSLTVPGIGAVVDSGLVRRTRYHGGRGVLTLLPVAEDAAEQRRGRAGRLGPGLCVRLWSRHVALRPSTPPEIHREALGPLVLAAKACGSDPASLPWLDPPRDFALAEAERQLQALGALGGDGSLTPRGERLFGLPLDPALGRLLLEGRRQGLTREVVALCAALSTPRRLFLRRPEDPDDDLRHEGCDALGLLRAVLEGQPGRHGLDPVALSDARRLAERFAELLDAPEAVRRGPARVDRRRLAEVVLAAWPDAAHVARRRKKHTAWSSGGTELALGRDSVVDEQHTEALLVLAGRALGKSETQKQLVITAAMPVPLPWLVAAGLGEERVGEVVVKKGEVLARTELVYAGRVLLRREVPPEGAAARLAVRDLLLRGAALPGVAAALPERLAERGLYAQLAGESPWPEAEDYLLERLEALGLESARDLPLLSPEDLLPEPLPDAERERLLKDYPLRLSIGDAGYELAYDLKKREVVLHQVRGTRKDPPPDLFVPRLPGFRVLWEYKNRVRRIRDRR